MRAAVIKNDVVDNIIIYSENYTPEYGTQIVILAEQEFVDIGYIYLNGKFIPYTPEENEN